MKHSELRHQPRHVNPRIQDVNSIMRDMMSQTVDKALREIMFLGAFFYHYKDVWV